MVQAIGSLFEERTSAHAKAGQDIAALDLLSFGIYPR